MLIQSASPLITAKQEESKSKAFKSVRQRQQSREIERDRELRRGEEGIKIEKKRLEQPYVPQAIGARIDQRMKMGPLTQTIH